MRNKGFSLVELLAVIAISLVLAVIFLPAAQHALDKDRAIKLVQVNQALTKYITLTGHIPHGNSTVGMVKILEQPIHENDKSSPALVEKDFPTEYGGWYLTYVPEFQRFNYVNPGKYGSPPANYDTPEDER